MKTIGKDSNSLEYWKDLSGNYVSALGNDYHKHRLGVIRDLIPKSLYVPGKMIFDFGCGDAVLFPEFLDAGASIRGSDISPEMIDLAHQRLSEKGGDESLAILGGVEVLGDFEDASLDAILSFNVLAYLTLEEERAFYEQARRIIKPGGFLIVTHSNELFDMFSLNRFTVAFYEKNFLQNQYKEAGINELLSAADKPSDIVTYNVRENPLSYAHKLRTFGFDEIEQRFINHHPAPPSLLPKERVYASTLDVPESERWKLMFTCSTFGSCAQRIT